MPSNTVINTNILSLNATRNLGKVGGQLSKASARLSSGLRINSAADDAAGLAISEKMRSQIRGLDQSSRNAQDGQALVNTAEGGMEQMQEMTQRMRELAVQSANDTNTSSDRALIQKEVDQLQEEMNSMADRVEYNGKKLLDGSTGSVTLHIGANKDQTIVVDMANMSSKPTTINIIGADGTVIGTTMSVPDSAMTDLVGTVDAAGNLTGGIDVTTQQGAEAAIETCDTAIKYISESRANLGAVSNRLDYTNNSLQISSENLSAAESRIRDADMAKEMMNYTKANVMQQAATSMLAQANQAPNNVLSLLG